jgi:hypothetical protein
MTVSFNPLKANGQLFTHLPELDDVEFSLSNTNAADVLDALGIEDSFSASPWPLPCFKALLVVARRKRIGHASPAIPLTETREPGSILLIDCGRDEGYIEQKLAVPPPHETRFGGRLALSRVHWVRLVLVAEITYLTWADDGLLRHTVFVGLRDDKPPREVRRDRPA